MWRHIVYHHNVSVSVFILLSLLCGNNYRIILSCHSTEPALACSGECFWYSGTQVPSFAEDHEPEARDMQKNHHNLCDPSKSHYVVWDRNVITR
jgi:hypothetical protein